MLVEGAVGLVGRDAQIAAIANVRSRALDRRAQVVVVEGEAGMGKSRLLSASVADADADGFVVLSGRYEGPDWQDALTPIVTALEIAEPTDDEHHRAVLQALRPVSSPAAPLFLSATTPSNQDAVVRGLAAAVAARASRTPVMLIIDDVHWGTSATFVALMAIVDACMDLPVLVLIATRPPVNPDTTQGLAWLDRAGATHLRLEPLDHKAVVELATATLSAPPGPRLSRQLARSGGHPLLIVELLRALNRESLVEIADGVVETSVDGPPPTLGAHVLGALDHLSDETRGVLRLAALLHERFTMNELALVAGRPATQLIDSVEEALRSGLLVDRDAHLSFQHDLIKAVVYESVPASVRVGVHRQIAETLVANGAPINKIASHFALGADDADEEAASWLRRAARDIVGHDPSGAANLLARAEEIVGGASTMRATLLAERLDALILSSRLDEADVLSRELVHLQADTKAAADVQRRRAVVLLLQNMAAEAADILDEISGIDGAGSEARAEAALAALCTGDLRRAVASAQRIEADADASASARALATCIFSRAEAMALELEHSLELAERAVAVADADPTGEAHRYQPLLFQGFSLHDLDRLDETASLAATAQRVAEERGLGFAAPLLHGLAAFTHWRAGQLEGVVAEAEAGVRRGEQMHMGLAAAWCHGLLALVAVHRDEIAVAEDAIAMVDESLAHNAPLLGFDLAVLAHARLAEARGDVSGAFEQLLASWQFLEAAEAYTMLEVLGPDVVRLGVDIGEADRVECVIGELERAAEVVAVPSWRAAAQVARGRAQDDVEALVAGASLLLGSPRRLDAGDALTAAGIVAHRHGDEARAHRLLADAISIYDRCGARRDRARAASWLREAGGRVPRVAAPAAERGLLSPAEEEVTRLVLAGLSNPEIAERLFVSRRTVESHLRRIFSKLDVASRVELAVWANDASSRRRPPSNG